MRTLSDFYQSVFGCKAYKLSLDAGCTCPNRDGTKGRGGCIFCSERGSGDFASGGAKPVAEQITQAKALVEKKLRGRSGTRTGVYIAYFQNFTATYGDPARLIALYREALSQEGVAGLAVATRADCVSDEILAALADIARTHFVQIELGLQTSNEATGTLINRCYTNTDYADAVRRISTAVPHIHIVTHLIFGLPGETERDMMESVRFVVQANGGACSWGIKLTSLYVVTGTVLCRMYEEGRVQVLEKAAYFSLVKQALALLPENCVVHRLTGDPPKRTLVAPLWAADKKRVLNELRTLL